MDDRTRRYLDHLEETRSKAVAERTSAESDASDDLDIDKWYEEHHSIDERLDDAQDAGVSTAKDDDGTLLSGEDLDKWYERAEDYEREARIRFSEMDQTRGLPDDFLVLNDLTFENVPTAAIRTEAKADVFVGETLRTKAPVVDTSGRAATTVTITLAFDEGRPQQEKLRRLVGEIMHHPFVFVENRKIRDDCAFSSTKTMVFVLESCTLRSGGAAVGTIFADLVLHTFNYKPFSNHFWYNAYMPGQRTRAQEDNAKPNLNLDELEDNLSEVDIYKQIASESIMSDLPMIEGVVSSQTNVPVIFPSESEAWMRYAGNLENQLPRINSKNSDFFGFKYRRYMYVDPPEEARGALGNMKRILYEDVEYPKPDALYDPHSVVQKGGTEEELTAREQRTKAVTKATRRGPPVVKYKWQEIRNQLFLAGEDFWENAGALREGAHLSSMLLADKKGWVYDYRGASKCNIHFFETLHRSGYEVKSALVKRERGYGYPNVTTMFKNIDQGLKWGVRITEKSAEAINYVIESGTPVGLLWEHPAHVVILTDIKNIQHDANGRIVSIKASYVDQHGVHEHTKTRRYRKKDNTIARGRMEIVQAIPAKNSTYREETTTASDREEEVTSPIPTEKKTVPKTTETPKDKKEYKKVLRARKAWIDKIEEQGILRYYREQPEIKNVFYEDISYYISSEPGVGLPNITCTAFSLTFGHRLASQHICGQEGRTWQFLGAGNKMGTIVLSFAGREGRISARRFKEMFDAAQENMRNFPHIKGGSAIRLYFDPETFLPTGILSRNAILALSKVKHAVITDVEMASEGDAVDKHQLVVNFIAQDFAEENLLQRDVIDINFKQIVIQKLCGLLTRKITDAEQERIALYAKIGNELNDEIRKKYKIKNIKNVLAGKEKITSRDIGTANEAWIEQFTELGQSVASPVLSSPVATKLMWLREDATVSSPAKDISKITGKIIPNSGLLEKYSDVPWLEKLVKRVAEVCNETDDKIPPTNWRVYGSPKTAKNVWRNQYASFGAAHVMRGKLKNAPKDEDYDWRLALGEGIAEGRQGSDRHSFGFLDIFLPGMNEITKDVWKFIGKDPEGFKEVFGNIGDNFIQNIIKDAGSCYKDMLLPTLKSGDSEKNSLRLQPDFYLYDDSSEDGLMSGGQDEIMARKFIEAQARREQGALKNYLKDSLLGGAYISQNLPKVLQARRNDLEENGAEYGFDERVRRLIEGKIKWDPLTYHYNTEDKSQEFKDWLGTRVVDNTLKYGPNHTDQGGVEEAKGNYLDSILSLNPGAYQGRHWFSPDQKGDDKERADYVKYLRGFVYGEQWNRMAFGPNEDYQRTDSILAGEFAAEAKKQESTPSTEKANTGDGASVTGEPSKEVADEPEGFLETVGSYFTKVANYLAQPTAGEKKWIHEDVIAPLQSKAIEEELRKPLSAEEERDQAEQIAREAVAFGMGTKAKDISMRRAYPTFKIYFIEDDAYQSEIFKGETRKAFDDFYSYSAIQEIKVIKSRKVAADLATIRMTNVAGILYGKRFGDIDPQYNKHGMETAESRQEEDPTGILSETTAEHPFAKLILKEGVKVQIRLGYSSDPDLLDTVFLGSIVEIAPSSQGKILEIVCQGYGAELTAAQLGPLEDGPTYYSTQSVLSAAIIQEFVANFGRRSRTASYTLAEMRHSFYGGDARTIEWTRLRIQDIVKNVFRQWSEASRHVFFRKYRFMNDPQDDNIFAPPPSVYTTSSNRAWNNACAYRPIQQTPWEIFKEHELRHPGFVALPLPYGHAPRMTMFFGVPGQNYWSRPPSNLELHLSYSWADDIHAMGGLNFSNPSKMKRFIKFLKKAVGKNEDLFNAIKNDLCAAIGGRHLDFYIGKASGRYRPFRNYHMFTSDHHIISNEIRTSVANTYNQAEILYAESEDSLLEDDAEDTANYVQDLVRGTDGVYSVKLDENIPSDKIRSIREAFPGCVTKAMAKRYASGLLMRHLKDCYQGELIVLGEPSIKPYDVAIVNDKTIDMYGPIEIEQVIHVFNREHGFISIVTPDMVVHANEFSSMTAMDMTLMAMSALWGEATSSLTEAIKSKGAGIDAVLAGVGVGAAIGAIGPVKVGIGAILGFLGLFGAVKLAMYNQEGAPVLPSPMVLGGKPFVSATTPSDMTPLLTTFGSKWQEFYDDLETGWYKLDISEEFFSAKLSVQEWWNNIRAGETAESIPKAGQ